MKVFFDTNVYIAEALLGQAAEQMLSATVRAKWRIFLSDHVLDEIHQVLVEDFAFSTRLARLTQQRCIRRSQYVAPRLARHTVSDDRDDSPILQAAVEAAADYLITNDMHLLRLNPYESLRIISMSDYYRLLRNQGLL